MEDYESHENRFVIIADVPDLQEMASHQLARSIWYNYIANLDEKTFRFDNFKQIYDLYEVYRDGCCNIIKSLNVPRSIEKKLTNELTRIVREIESWGQLFLPNQINECVWNPFWCVWLPNGEIDHKSSAAKAISNPGELNNDGKFAIMCKFCLEEEIVEFPMNLLSRDFTEGPSFPADSLIEYWYYFKKNQLHVIERLCNTSLNANMALLLSDNWTAFQYFWRRLDADEQVSVAKAMFGYSAGYWIHVEKLLSMMSWQQQRRMLSLNLGEIIQSVTCHGNRLQTLRWVWRYSEHLMNVEIFINTVKCLFRFKFDAEEWMEWWLEVWDSAPKKYKTEAFGAVRYRLEIPTDESRWPCRSGFKFLRKIVSMSSVGSRENMLRTILSMLNAVFRRNTLLDGRQEQGSFTAVYDSMDELINVFVPSKDDQLRIKRSILKTPKMEKICIELVQTANLVDLDLLLEFYLDTSDEIIQFKKRLLTQSGAIPEQFMYKSDHWKSLCVFIGELYPDHSTSVQIRKQLIMSCVVKFTNCNSCKICENADGVAQFIQIVELEFTEDELPEVRNNLFNSFQSMLTTQFDHFWYRSFLNRMYFYRFVKWCVGDGDKAIDGYEYGPLVDTVFNAVFGTMDNLYNDFDDTDLLFYLDKFFLWYLKSDAEVKKYKLVRINSYQNLAIFQSILYRNDKFKLQTLLNWFFHDDVSAVRDFSSNFFPL